MDEPDQHTVSLHGEDAASPPTDELVGRFIGGYRVTHKIGQGGMGAVYVGAHDTLGRRVAIKVLLPEVSGHAEYRRRFFDEARAVAALESPNIVQVIDLATLPSGRCYILMEYLEGEPLGRMLARVGRFTPAAAVAIVAEVLSGLAVSHQAGIVHRDLKPANLFVARSKSGARVKILDFGIAKLKRTQDDLLVTRADAVLGTPGYMAPEQADGDARRVDPRADLYALGIVLYELCAGSRPVVRVAARERALPAAPPALEEAIGRALDPDPERRFASAEAMRTALIDAVGGADALPAIPEPVIVDGVRAQAPVTIDTGTARGPTSPAHRAARKPTPPAAAAPASAPAPAPVPAPAPPSAPASRRLPSAAVLVGLGVALAGGGYALVRYLSTAPAAALTADAGVPSVLARPNPANPPLPRATVSSDAAVVASAPPPRHPSHEHAPARPPPLKPGPDPGSTPATAATPATPATPPAPTETAAAPPPGRRSPLAQHQTIQRSAELSAGALKWQLALDPAPRVALTVHVASDTVSSIRAELRDVAGNKVGSQRRLPPSKWDGCEDCAVWIDGVLGEGKHTLTVWAKVPGRFTVTVTPR